MPSFYNGRRFFLTWPQCHKSQHELVAYLEDKAPIKRYVVSRELHEDGNPHLHACVEFVTTQRRPVNWLDSFDKHPNKQDPRKWNACISYVKKDGDYIDGPETDEVQQSLLEILENLDSELDWMEYCVKSKISFQYAQYFWQRNKQDVHSITEETETNGKLCPALETFTFPFTGKTLVLKGPTGCGKTTWAKKNVPKPALFVRHVDTLKKFRPGFHKSIIFDDVDFRHFPRSSQIYLVDFDDVADIHCRHACAFIPAGIHKVFTCNEWPLIEDPAINRRCRKYTVRVNG